MTARAQYNLDLAQNLIETLGAQRALHVAVQFAWYGVAEEIAIISKETGGIHRNQSIETREFEARWTRPMAPIS